MFEQYKVSTAADGKVCSKCADISHQVFYIKDRTPGVNFPPLHPWCRCTFEIYVEDWDKWQDDYIKRQSKNPDKILKSLKSNDIINADVDELVPCLKNAKTGKIVETYVREMSRNELAEYTLKNGWSDNWKDRPQEFNAVHIPTRTHEYQFFIDTEDAINLLRKYNYERK